MSHVVLGSKGGVQVPQTLSNACCITLLRPADTPLRYLKYMCYAYYLGCRPIEELHRMAVLKHRGALVGCVFFPPISVISYQ